MKGETFMDLFVCGGIILICLSAVNEYYGYVNPTLYSKPMTDCHRLGFETVDHFNNEYIKKAQCEDGTVITYVRICKEWSNINITKCLKEEWVKQ